MKGGRSASLLVTGPDDPRLAPFRSLRARTEAGEAVLVADGVRVLVNVVAAGAGIESVLCDEASADRVEKILSSRPGVPLYVAPAEMIRGLVGYGFHRGVLAALSNPGTVAVEKLGPRVAVLCGLDKGENVGAVIRNCAAFGADSVIVAPGTATPFQRNAIRASRGYLFRVRVHEAPDLAGTLSRLKSRGYRLIAADQGASAAYDEADPGAKWALLLGNEGHGLPPEAAEGADLRVRIPMAEGVESLNVASAAAVILSRFSRRP